MTSVPPSRRRSSLIAQHAVGRHNAPAYADAGAAAADAESNAYRAAHAVAAQLRAVAAQCGLDPKCVVACYQEMGRMGRAAHLPAGSPRCRETALCRLAQDIAESDPDRAPPHRRHCRECLSLAQELLGADAAADAAVLLAEKISEGQAPPALLNTPQRSAAARRLASDRHQHPAGLWRAVAVAGREDLPSDALLGRMAGRIAATAGQPQLNLPETERLYRLLKHAMSG